MSNTIPDPDFRMRRAEVLAAELTREVEDVVRDPQHRPKDIFERLFDVLYRNGAAWTTDEEREKLGFEPRDDLGWTASERLEAERRRVESLQFLMARFMEPKSASQNDG